MCVMSVSTGMVAIGHQSVTWSRYHPGVSATCALSHVHVTLNSLSPAGWLLPELSVNTEYVLCCHSLSSCSSTLHFSCQPAIANPHITLQRKLTLLLL